WKGSRRDGREKRPRPISKYCKTKPRSPLVSSALGFRWVGQSQIYLDSQRRRSSQKRWGRGEIVRDWLDDLNALSIVATCLISNHKQRPSHRTRIRLKKKRAP